MKMQCRTEFDYFQVTEKDRRNTVLEDLFVVFAFTLMMVKLGKSIKMEDCKKRENSISVARCWGTNWGKINLFTPRILWRHCSRLLRHYTFSRTEPFYLNKVPTLSLTSQWMIELRLFHLHRESNISDQVIVIQIALRLVLNEVLFFYDKVVR